VTSEHVISANVGDSRVLLFPRDGPKAGQPYLPIFTTQDHTPALKSESSRIIKSGGVLKPSYLNSKPVGPVRIWRKNGDLPGLMMSRSFGDAEGHKVGVICEPDVWVGKRNQISAVFAGSDGASERVTPREIGAIISKNINSMGSSHYEIAKLASKRWISVRNLLILETLLYG